MLSTTKYIVYDEKDMIFGNCPTMTQKLFWEISCEGVFEGTIGKYRLKAISQSQRPQGHCQRNPIH